MRKIFVKFDKFLFDCEVIPKAVGQKISGTVELTGWLPAQSRDENDPTQTRQRALAAAPPPWIFESAIAKGGGDSGETVRVESHEGQFLAGRRSARIRASEPGVEL